MPRRRLAHAATALVTAALLSATTGLVPLSAQAAPTPTPTPTVSAAALPPGFVRHAGPSWVWFGPRPWIASYGTYGISISSPSGRDSLDIGFSSTICASAPDLAGSVRAYFAAKQRSYRQLGLRNLKAGPVRRMPAAQYGPNYFRQVTQARAVNGVPLRGDLTADYAINDRTYCYARDTGRFVPANGFRARMRVLAAVQKTLAYSGPGAPLEIPQAR